MSQRSFCYVSFFCMVHVWFITDALFPWCVHSGDREAGSISTDGGSRLHSYLSAFLDGIWWPLLRPSGLPGPKSQEGWEGAGASVASLRKPPATDGRPLHRYESSLLCLSTDGSHYDQLQQTEWTKLVPPGTFKQESFPMATTLLRDFVGTSSAPTHQSETIRI